jgi:hypothetical protein
MVTFQTKSYIIFIFIFLLAACDKKTEVPKGRVLCPWDFRINAPLDVNNLTSIMKLGDTLKFRISIPFQSINLVTGDSIDLSIFNDVWGGVLVTRQIHYSEATVPGVYYVNDRDGFKYISELNIFEKDKKNYSLLFKYQKTDKEFRVNINCTPIKKGTFLFNFLSSGSRDAFCANSMPHFIVNYQNTDFIYLLNEAIGKDVIPNNIVLPTNYYIRVE